MLLLVYVDDIIITANDDETITQIIAQLSRKFALKDLGIPHCFLGIEVNYFSCGLFLSQTKYGKDLLTQTKLLAALKFATPITDKPQKQPDDQHPINTTEF